MKNINLLLMLAALALINLNHACHDHEEDDTASPSLTINKPGENASILGEVAVEGIVSDESLHELNIKVTKDSDGSELFSSEPDIHDKSEYTFNERFTPAGLSVETPVTLTITVSDHSENKTTKTVKFRVRS